MLISISLQLKDLLLTELPLLNQRGHVADEELRDVLIRDFLACLSLQQRVEDINYCRTFLVSVLHCVLEYWRSE